MCWLCLCSDGSDSSSLGRAPAGKKLSSCQPVPRSINLVGHAAVTGRVPRTVQAWLSICLSACLSRDAQDAQLRPIPGYNQCSMRCQGARRLKSAYVVLFGFLLKLALHARGEQKFGRATKSVGYPLLVASCVRVRTGHCHSAVPRGRSIRSVFTNPAEPLPIGTRRYPPAA